MDGPGGGRRGDGVVGSPITGPCGRRWRPGPTDAARTSGDQCGAARRERTVATAGKETAAWRQQGQGTQRGLRIVENREGDSAGSEQVQGTQRSDEQRTEGQKRTERKTAQEQSREESLDRARDRLRGQDAGTGCTELETGTQGLRNGLVQR